MDLTSLRSFVALGDSFTEGLHDDVGPGGRHLGWADRVAAALATLNGGLRYANLAVRGRLLHQVVTEQVPAAIELGADLVSFHAGPNDLLRPRGSAPVLLREYEDAVARLRGTGAQVVLFTVIERAGGSGRTADRLAARFGAFNAGVREVAQRQGCVLVDVGCVPALQDRRLWHEDRLHLAPAGHLRVAAAVLEQLGVTDGALLGSAAGGWREPLPAAVRRWRGADLLADARWLRRYFLPWLGRRLRGVSSGDAMSPKHTELVEIRPPDPASRA